MRSIGTACAVALVVAACGGRDSTPGVGDGGSGTEGYDWCSAAPDNCWKQALAALSDCGAPEAYGALSEDRMRCDYRNGVVLRFAEPALPFDADDIDVTIERDGAFCARYVADGLDMTLETATGVLALDVDAEARRATVTCPDGRRYALTGTPTCGSDPGDWPFTTTEGSAGDSVRLELGGGPTGPVDVLQCEVP